MVIQMSFNLTLSI